LQRSEIRIQPLSAMKDIMCNGGPQKRTDGAGIALLKITSTSGRGIGLVL